MCTRGQVSGNVLSSMSGKLLVSANGVGIGTSTMDAADKLVVNGPIRISDGGTRPSCSASHRGMLWHEFGELGVGDSVDACVKNKYDDYEWRSVVPPPTPAFPHTPPPLALPLARPRPIRPQCSVGARLAPPPPVRLGSCR